MSQKPNRRSRSSCSLSEYLKESFASLGMEPQSHLYKYTNIQPVLDLALSPMRGENTYALLPARVDTEEIIVVCAHHDTVRSSPGADDNATGVGGVLSIAARITSIESRSKHVVFVLFDQEEHDNGPGRKTFVLILLNRQYRIHSRHNIDMLGFDGEAYGWILTGPFANEVTKVSPDSFDKVY